MMNRQVAKDAKWGENQRSGKSERKEECKQGWTGFDRMLIVMFV